jgi:hypothetical protein
VLFGVALLWMSCQKEVSNSSTQNQPEKQSQKNSGAIIDNLTRESKVPTIMSADLLAHSSAITSSYSISSLSRSLRGGGKIVKHLLDLTPPTVSITSPSNGTSVSGSISVTVTAADNVKVSSVSLNVDGALIDSLTTTPYNFSWNSSSVANGTHVLAATAKDAAGNSASSGITIAVNTTVTVLPPTTLPSSYQLIMPPVQSQGNEFTCIPFAIAYATRSCEQFYKTGATSYSYSTNIFSTEFVYNQTKFSTDCSSGTSAGTVFDFLIANGVCTWASMPYSGTDGCSLMPNSTQITDAAKYKITSYSKILKEDQTAIKTLIVANHPVIAVCSLDQSFYDSKPGFIWKTYSSTPGLAHGLAICGYDDSKHAYKVMNSWGTGWGDAGYTWIDYDFFPQTVYYYVYSVTL